MNRSPLIVVLLVLAGFAAGIAWISNPTVGVPPAEEVLGPIAAQAAEIPAAERAVELPIPGARPGESGPNSQELSDAVGPRRQVMPQRQDYAVVYAQWPLGKLYERSTELTAIVERVKSARFEQLQEHFDQLVATRKYGARVTELGKAFDDVPAEIGRKQAYSARTVELPNGEFVMHVLEFCPAQEPATADLVAELDWLRAKLGQ